MIGSVQHLLVLAFVYEMPREEEVYCELMPLPEKSEKLVMAKNLFSSC